MTRKSQVPSERATSWPVLVRRVAVLSAAAIALPLATAVVAGAAPAARAASQPVIGTAAPSHAGSTRTGDAPAASRMSVAVTLPLRDESALRSFLVHVSDPRSPQYGRYLTSAQFDTRYAPTPASVDTVAGYLRLQGLSVSSISSNRTVIDATGTVAQVEKAFDTTIGRYHDEVLNRDYSSNDREVSLPSSVAAKVLGVVGLDNHYLHHTPKVGSGPAGGYTPSELKTAYDVNPLATAGYTGSGQTVGLFELAAYKQTNVTTYDNQYSLGSPTPTVTSVDGGTTTLGNAEVEVELDIEVVQALAPKANVKVFEAPNSDQGVIDGYNSIATSNTTASNSTSWGECEANSSTSTINSEDQIFQQMASQGQSLFAASGDSAAYDCGTQGTLGVDNPADDPYVTGAGGTRLTVASGGTYTSEVPWDTNATEGGGGGVSTIFAKPSWQTGDNVPSSCASKRCVPDISADADPATGYSIYSQGSWTVVGGTSAAAPLWAGFAAAYDQDAVAAGKAKLGFANPKLYSLAGSAQTYPPFHDITTGHTSTATNWPATAGYDLATGIGSPDANNIARDLIGGTTATNDFSISASPTSVSVAQGSSGTSTISTAVTSGSAQSVALSASGLPAGVTASFSPTSVTAGASSTLTLTASSTATTGSYTLNVTGTGASATHTVSVTLTLTSTGGGSCTAQLVTNGGFESGSSPWTLSSGVLNNSTSEPAHSGSYDAWFDGYGQTHTDTGTQSITIPAGCTTATVQFYLHIDTAETTTSTAYDIFTAKLGSTTLGTFSNLNKASGYVVHSYNVSGLTGGSTYTLSFSGKEDSSLQTSFVLDDVSIIG